MSKFVIKSVGDHRYEIFHVGEYQMEDLLAYVNEVCQWCKKQFGNDYLTWNVARNGAIFTFNPNECVETPKPRDELIFKLTWTSNVVQTVSNS